MTIDLIASALKGNRRDARYLIAKLRDVGLRIVVDDAHLASEAMLFEPRRDEPIARPPVDYLDV